MPPTTATWRGSANRRKRIPNPAPRAISAAVRSKLERSEELAETPREESERDRDRHCNGYVRWMLGVRCSTSHDAGIGIASLGLKSGPCRARFGRSVFRALFAVVPV